MDSGEVITILLVVIVILGGIIFLQNAPGVQTTQVGKCTDKFLTNQSAYVVFDGQPYTLNPVYYNCFTIGTSYNYTTERGDLKSFDF